MKQITVADLHFSYGNRKVLNGINFSLDQGEILCVFGPNGCGKTTMLECILGFNKPESGSIKYGEQSLCSMKIAEIAKKVAYVPQKTINTFGFSVLEIVLMGRTAGLSMFSSPDRHDLDIAEECLEKVGMYDFKNRSFNELSGGETQLVKLARALAQRTKLIIFDEPTSHLDFRHELSVLKYMCTLVKEENLSMIISTHFPNQALYLENRGIPVRVALMENGTFGAQGNASATLNEVNMKRIFNTVTKVFKHQANENELTYMVPLDFIDGGPNEKGV